MLVDGQQLLAAEGVSYRGCRTPVMEPELTSDRAGVLIEALQEAGVSLSGDQTLQADITCKSAGSAATCTIVTP